MADDIEVGDLVARISFDDTGLNSSMAAINRSMQLVRAEFDSASSALGAYSSEEERLEALSTNLNRQIQLQQQRVNVLNAAFQESVREKGEDAAETQRLAIQLARAQTEYNQLNQRLSTTTNELEEQRTSANQAENAWERLQRTLDATSGGFKKAEDAMDNVGSKMSVGISAPLAALGGLAVNAATDFDGAMSLISARTGYARDNIEDLKPVLEGLFRDGIADSAQDAAAAVSTAFQVLGEDSAAGVNETVRAAKVLESVFEADYNATIATASVLMKNFGISNIEAFDIMTVGFQQGGDFSEELLDTLREYAPQFDALGYTAQEFADILIKGAKAGAFNLDKLGDVAKESFIRIGDGSKSSRGALGALGLDFTKIEQNINSGGEAANSAFAAVTAALASVKDPAARAQNSIALFGTPLEDLGPEFRTFFTDIQGGLTEFTRSTQKAGEDFNNNFASRLKSTWQTFQADMEAVGVILLKLADEWLPKISAAIADAATWFDSLGSAMQQTVVFGGMFLAALGPLLVILAPVVSAIGGLVASFGAAAGAGAAAGTGAAGLGAAFAAITGPIGIAIAAIAAIIAGIVILYNKNEDFRKFIDRTWDQIKKKFVDTWEAIKAYMLPIINEVMTFVQEQLGELKAVWDEHGAAIMAVVKSTFGIIFGYIKIQMAAVETIIRVVWAVIEGVIRIAWETIKLVISTALDVIIGGVRVFAKLFQGDWKGAFDAAFDTMKKIWGNAERWFHGINLLEIGKNIIDGLLKGIDSMVGAVEKQVEKIAKVIPEGIRDFLGIHSPSKVTTDLGYYTAKGLAKGIESGEKDVAKAAEKVAKASYDATKDWIDERKYYNKITLEEELKVWNSAATKYKAGSEQRKSVDREIFRVKQELLKAEEAAQKKSFDASKKWVEDKKEFNQLSLIQELAAWERVQERYKAGTKEHEDAERNIINVRKEIYNALTQAGEEFLTKTKEINANVEAEELRLNEVYAQAVDERAKSIYSFSGLFDEVTRKADVAGSQLISNLENQISYLETWAVNLHELAARGIDEGLVEELRLMGPNAYAEISALNSMTDSELFTFQSLWKEKTELARFAALDQMTGLRTDTDAQIVLLKKEASKQLDGLKKVFEDKVREIRTGTVGGFNIMTAELPDIGKQAMQGLIDGMDGMKNDVMSKAREIANAVSKTIQKALDIHSPSRVKMELGDFAGMGLAEGLENSLKNIQRQAVAMAELAVPVMKGLQVPDLKGIDSASISAASAPNIINNYEFAPGSVIIPAADIAQMKSINDFFARFQQTARARG